MTTHLTAQGRPQASGPTLPIIPAPGSTYISVAAPPVAYTLTLAADACSLSISTLRAAIRKGTLPARWVGRKPIVRHDDLVQWVDELSQDDPADLY